MSRIRDKNAGSGSGPLLVGTLDLTALGNATYNSNGAQTLGGFSFNTQGLSATETIQFVSGSGLNRVLGTGTVGINFDPETHFGYTMGEQDIWGVTARMDDGTISNASDQFILYCGADDNNKTGVFRSNNAFNTAIRRSAAFAATQNVAVVNATDVRFMGVTNTGAGCQGYYSTVDDALAPDKLSTMGASNRASQIVGADNSFAQWLFTNGPGQFLTHLYFYKYSS